MLFNLASIIELIKDQVTATEAHDTAKIRRCIGLCLDDLATRLKSDSMLTVDTDTIAAGTRETKLTGASNDLQHIYMLKYGTGASEILLEYKDPEYFVRNFDDPSVSAGTPTYYTILVADEGYPKVKFDVPTSASDTLTIYYILAPSLELISYFKSSAAIIHGTLAYFYGLKTPEGTALYANFNAAAARLRAIDSFLRHSVKQLSIGGAQLEAMKAAKNLRNNRV